ncbi:MAG: hypothetical protein LBV19_08160 [Streptococcaceae bacterium]|nr:hypothetical protein [Streptococcaceae bacterium]
MAKTIEEVRQWLDSMVNTRPYDKQDPINSGQCVSLIKTLLEFLGVPNPYAARGDAKDYGDALLSQGIAKNGSGLLNVHVNRLDGKDGYGVIHGHIWVTIGRDLWQSNYMNDLKVTKNTPQSFAISQTINLDRWLSNNNSNSKGGIKMYIIQCSDTGHFYVSNGVDIRYIKTTRVLDAYQSKWAKLGLPIDVMYQGEVDKEFGKNATNPNRDIAKC